MRIAPLSLLALSLVLAACRGVGEGNQPISMKLVDGQTGAEEIVVFQCFERNLGARVTFTNGQVSDFLAAGGSRPVRLSSSDETVLRVSDGTLEVPGRPDQRYLRGALIPVAPGTAIVTAEFSDLRAETTITVKRPDSIRVEPREQTVALGTAQAFSLVAVLDEARTTATTLGIWALEDGAGQPVDEAVGLIGSGTGVVAALAEQDGLTVQARLSGCPDVLPSTVDPADLRAAVRFKPATGLTLSREFVREDENGDPLPAQPLVLNTSEAFTVTAQFADPAHGSQDISTQVRYGIVDPSQPETPVEGEAPVVRAIFGLLGQRNLLSALLPTESGQPLSVRARFGGETDEDGEPTGPVPEELVSNAIEVETLGAQLQSIVIEPADVVLPRFGQQRYRAIGRFTFGDDGELFQDIRRHVAWTSSVPAVAAITSTAASPALAQAVQQTAGCTFIRARALVPVDEELVAVTAETRLFVIDDTAECAVDAEEGEG